MTSFPLSTSLLSHRNSFWALLLSMYPDNHPIRNMMSSIMQRLLWETNRSLALISPGKVESEFKLFCDYFNCSESRHLKDSIFYSKYLDQGIVLEGKTGSSAICPYLLNINKQRSRMRNMMFLRLNCTDSKSNNVTLSFTECAHKLMTSLIHNNSSNKNNHEKGKNEHSGLFEIMTTWFKFLQKYKYVFPERDNRNPYSSSLVGRSSSSKNGVPVWFTPSPCKPQNRMTSTDRETNVDVQSGSHERDNRLAHQASRLVEDCHLFNVSIDPHVPHHFAIPDILLLVVFNYP